MSQTVLMWSVAALLCFWQVCLTFMVLRVREDEANEVANIGRMAYGFSAMLDRLEGMLAYQQGHGAPHGHPGHPSSVPATPAHGGAYGHPEPYAGGWGPHAVECSCPVHPGRNNQASYEPAVGNGWGGTTYPHAVPRGPGGRRRS